MGRKNKKQNAGIRFTRELFSRLLRASEAGLVKREQRIYVDVSLPKCVGTNLHPVSIYGVNTDFLILFGGFLFGTIMLLSEIAIKCISNRCEKTKIRDAKGHQKGHNHRRNKRTKPSKKSESFGHGYGFLE